jgi:beta-lactamase regulating signal transducer with metallopeptidase domain
MNPFFVADFLSPIVSGAAHSGAAAFQAFAQVAAPAAVAALWQGVAVAIALAVCLRVAPRVSATQRFIAWAAGFAVLIGLQLFPVFARFVPATSTGPAFALTGTSPHPWFELDAWWSMGLAGLWIALAAVRAADLALHTIRLRRLWTSAVPVPDSVGAELASSRRRMQVCTTRELDRPSVIGFLAPRVLIPDWLYARLTPGELEQVVLHEAEHLRRRDDWTNLLQKLCLVLFPLNPALAWIERRLCREREMACDEGVVRVTRAPRAYAACLASLAERRLQRRAEALSLGALSLGAFESRSELVHRVHSILLRKSVLNPLGSRALLGVMGCGLLLGSMELARCPQVVAFMPAHAFVSASAQANPARLVPATYSPAHGQDLAPFRAVNAKAILPADSRRAAMIPLVERHAAGARQTHHSPLGMKSSDLASTGLPSRPRQQLVKADLSGSPPSVTQEPQEWVVLTTWQVQSPARGPQATADYDIGARPSEPAQDGQPSESASRITVTRLILKIYPVTAARDSAQAKPERAASKPTANSTSVAKTILGRPALLPFDSGWLVLQL